MASVLIQAADAVVTAINAATLPLEFKCKRSYADWDMELSDTDADRLRVDVVPVLHDNDGLQDRGAVEYLCPVDVGIRKRISQDDQATGGEVDNDAIDPLVELLEGIFELFAASRLEDFTDATWSVGEVRSSHNREHLRQWRQFTGIVRITFNVRKVI
jgi:hypothetical protein